MNKESFYFPHDYDAASDPKMQALIGKYGGLGYGIYWRVVEMLHASSEHRLCRKPYLYSAIAKQMLVSDEQMLEIITYAVDFCELFETDGETFWSNRVNKNFERRAEISEKRSFAGKMSAVAKANAKQISTNVEQISTSVEQISTSVQQNSTNTNKGKEKKGKEIKEKRTVVCAKQNTEFDLFWNLYPEKNGKAEALDRWNKLNGERPVIEVILAAIQNQIDWRKNAAVGEFIPHWKNPATWLNKGCWDDVVKTTNKNSIDVDYAPILKAQKERDREAERRNNEPVIVCSKQSDSIQDSVGSNSF